MSTITINPAAGNKPMIALLSSITLIGGTALTDGKVQLFTQATGQRHYTLADTLGALSEGIDSNTDATSDPEAPDTIYRFDASTSEVDITDTASGTVYASLQVWDDPGTPRTYATATWA